MTSIIIAAGASQVISPPHNNRIMLKSVEFVRPAGNTTAVTITASGATTGSYVFAGNVEPDLRFIPDEDVTISITGLQSVVKYITYGDDTMWKDCDHGNPMSRFTPPWRS